MYTIVYMYISCGDCIEMDRNSMRRDNVTGRGFIRSPIIPLDNGYEKGIIISNGGEGGIGGGKRKWNSR